MTFKEWLTGYLPDYESEYSGDIRAMEAAWNAAIRAVESDAEPYITDYSDLISTEFQRTKPKQSIFVAVRLRLPRPLKTTIFIRGKETLLYIPAMSRIDRIGEIQKYLDRQRKRELTLKSSGDATGYASASLSLRNPSRWESIKILTAEQRVELFNELRSLYCLECGTDKLPCHCANDE